MKTSRIQTYKCIGCTEYKFRRKTHLDGWTCYEEKGECICEPTDEEEQLISSMSIKFVVTENPYLKPKQIYNKLLKNIITDSDKEQGMAFEQKNNI